MSRLVQRWIDWLAAPQARDSDSGLWLSWSNSEHPGFPYEEATAWVTLAAAQRREVAGSAGLTSSVEQALPALRERIGAHGGLRLGGRRFAFDTGVALAALQAWGGAEETQQRLIATLSAFCHARVALDGGLALGDESPETRWSEAWGAHQLWLAGPLLQAGEETTARDLVAEVLPRVLRADGLLRVHGARDDVYAHAALYGAAGLLAAGERDLAAGVAVAALAARGADGLVPAWLAPARGPGRTDATAQALALVNATGADVPASVREHALAGLAACTAPCGGLRYEAGSADINCCATAFALALRDSNAIAPSRD